MTEIVKKVIRSVNDATNFAKKKPDKNLKCQYCAKTNHLVKTYYFCKGKDNTKGQEHANNNKRKSENSLAQ